MDERKTEELLARAECVKKKYEHIRELDHYTSLLKKEKEQLLNRIKDAAKNIRKLNERLIFHQQTRQDYLEEIGIVMDNK